jgi:hypothetical protein
MKNGKISKIGKNAPCKHRRTGKVIRRPGNFITVVFWRLMKNVRKTSETTQLMIGKRFHFTPGMRKMDASYCTCRWRSSKIIDSDLSSRI